jgi:organic hydroperoxide reductase OsmC/OhrA
MESNQYNVDINWGKTHKGMMCSPELNKENSFCIQITSPPEFPKEAEGHWSPEHLLVAALSGSLMSNFLAIAENSRLDFTDFSCRAKGKLESVEGRLMMNEILLEPRVVIHNEHYRHKAMRILKKAQDACLISHSVKSKIEMAISIEVKQLLIETY